MKLWNIVPNPLKGAQHSHVMDGLLWLGFTLLFGLLPLYGGALFLWFLSSELSLRGFVDHGEFAIYSAGLLAPALFIVVREYHAPFPQRAFWGLISIVLLVLVMIVFAAASAADAAPDVAKNVNRISITAASVILYSLALGTAFILTVQREALIVDAQAIRAKRTGSLEEEFDSTGG